MAEAGWQVVIADVMASRRIGAERRSRLAAEMRTALAQTTRWRPKAFRLAPQVLKGDEIQAVLRPDAEALHVVAYLRGRLAMARGGGIELRVGLGTGPIDRLSPRGPFESDGPAFHRARAALEAVERLGGTHRVGWQTGDAFFDPAAAATLGLLDALMTRWTLPQWEAVLGRLQDKGLREMARSGDVSIQSMSKRLHAASWSEVQAGLRSLESMAQILAADAEPPAAVHAPRVESRRSPRRG